MGGIEKAVGAGRTKRERTAAEAGAGTLKRRGAAKVNPAKPHLRFDKVAVRLIEHLQTACRESVPDGRTVLVAVTAPIRMASKTAAAIDHKIQTLVARGSGALDEKDTIHGNHVRLRVLRAGSRHAPKSIGFVHNPDTDPILLFTMTRDLLEFFSANAAAAKPHGDRRLVLMSPAKSACLEAYRYIYSQLCMRHDDPEIFIAFTDGHVEALKA